LEGFRFLQDASASSEEGKTLRQAAMLALRPELHLRADRFYNAPDTEFDFTEQGGLMWGEHAIGKLVKGPEVLRPTAEAFVDDEAGPEVMQKVQRRLQHFIDRKIANLFEPLLALSRDEAIDGLARGFAFQLVEALGVLPRSQVADDVKSLDQDARAVLRKHGIRFGQFTIFQQLLLKPAPTRLRLVLSGLSKGLSEFAESPPPGLVTIPAINGIDASFYTMSGYKVAGQRAIRIDMLERLADLLRQKDTRGGFEANADMLSITGMTLEQFSDLMTGLGYKAERGERAKVKVVPVAPETQADQTPANVADDVVDDTAAETSAETIVETGVEVAAEIAVETDADVPAEAAVEAVVEGLLETDVEVAVETPAEVPQETLAEAVVETEIFYTFSWAPRRRAAPQGQRRENDQPNTQGQPRGKPSGKPAGKPSGKPKGKFQKPQQRDDRPQTFSARPERKDRIDPDNPFAQALAGLKSKS
jgi:ATP-dependent RNA helicase SUPV3L1/SUV3